MDFFWHIVALTAMWIPNPLGFNLIFGKGKIFHFGPIGVSVVTAYAMVIALTATESYLLALLIGLLAALTVSLFFWWLSLRLEPDGLGVITIAVHLALLAIVLNWSSLTRGALGIPYIPRFPFLESAPTFALFALLIATMWFLFLFFLDRSSFGRKLAALSEHEWHAKSLGIDRAQAHLWAFLIGGVGAFLTNMLFPQYIRLLHPNDFTFPVLVSTIMVVVAGRPGSVIGVTIATILITLLREALRFVPMAADVLGPLRLILFGLILFIAVYYRRETLFPQERRV